MVKYVKLFIVKNALIHRIFLLQTNNDCILMDAFP